MDVGALVHGVFDGLGFDFPVRAWQQQDLGAVGKELGRAALGGLDVRQLVAEDAVVRLAERGQRKRIGRGAVEDEEHLAVGLEYVADQVGGLSGPGVVAIADFVALVGLGHGGEGFRANAGIIVAGKLAAGSSFITHAPILELRLLEGRKDLGWIVLSWWEPDWKGRCDQSQKTDCDLSPSVSAL